MVKEDKPLISILVNGYRCLECSSSKKFPYFEYAPPLKGVLESIEKQKYPRKEIIVVEEPTKKTEAIKKAKGEIIFLLCNDAVLVGQNVLDDIIKVFDETKADILIGSANRSRDMDTFLYVLNIEYEWRTYRMGEKWCDIGASTYMIVKKEVFDELENIDESPFIKTSDEKFNISFFDWDFCYMLSRKRKKIFHTNKIQVYHYYQCRLFDYLRKQFWQGWYRRIFQKGYGSLTESYADALVMAQPALVGLFTLSLLLLPFDMLRWITFVTLVLSFFFYLPLSLKYFILDKDLRTFLLVPLTFFRCYVWIAGYLYAFIKKNG